MNSDDMLYELYVLVQREESGSKLNQLEQNRYVELCDMLRGLNIEIPFGVSI